LFVLEHRVGDLPASTASTTKNLNTVKYSVVQLQTCVILAANASKVKCTLHGRGGIHGLNRQMICSKNLMVLARKFYNVTHGAISCKYLECAGENHQSSVIFG
jgi:hypothetical protein